MKWLVLVALCACGKSEPAPKKELPPLPAAEIQRGQDACNAYVTKVCACTSDAAKTACPLAKALPDALKLALDTAMNPETDRDNAMRAQVNVRETARQCIEQAAKLPALGCP